MKFSPNDIDQSNVIPAKAGIQRLGTDVAKSKDQDWIPAFAGMTNVGRVMAEPQ